MSDYAIAWRNGFAEGRRTALADALAAVSAAMSNYEPPPEQDVSRDQREAQAAALRDEHMRSREREGWAADVVRAIAALNQKAQS